MNGGGGRIPIPKIFTFKVVRNSSSDKMEVRKDRVLFLIFSGRKVRTACDAQFTTRGTRSMQTD